MSSHHVVRENQEPALFLLEQGSIDASIIQGMLEWSPLILVSDDCFSITSIYGIKADALICERNFANNYEIEISMQQPLDMVLVKDANTMTITGIDYLIDKGCTAINIFGKLSNEKMFEINRQFPGVTISYYHGKEKLVYAGQGKFEKWLPKNYGITIIPSFLEQEFKSKGLTYKKNKFVIDKPTNFITKNEGLVKIKSERREFFVREME